MVSFLCQLIVFSLSPALGNNSLQCSIHETEFLEGLLVNGWLTKLILTCARVETIICKWTLDMCMSSSSFFFLLQVFGLLNAVWCLGLISVVFTKRRPEIFCLWLLVFHTVITIRGTAYVPIFNCIMFPDWNWLLGCQTLWFNQVNGAPVEIEWLPNYQILKEALESYGFRVISSQDVELPEVGEFPCCSFLVL